MSITTIIGILAFLFSVIVSVFLFIVQARSANNLPLAIPGLLFLSFITWTFYSLSVAVLAHNWIYPWPLLAGQGFGMLTNGIILGRLVYYRLYK